MKKKDKLLLIGVILIVFGIFMFFKSTRVYTWGFYRIGNTVSTGGILIALTLFDLVFLVATKHRIAKILMPILIAMIVLSIVLGTQLSYYGSVLDLFLMLIPAAVGAGLVLRAMMMKAEKDSE
ncbi:MAG: hypothetical protein IJH48_07080 [Oscillospiraceae bacterium]|nr:hypothetical protein [Oscillospiraceae bacterium]